MSTGDDIAARAFEIGEAEAELRQRCLFRSAAWIAEQALAFEVPSQRKISKAFRQGRHKIIETADGGQSFTSGRHYFAQQEYTRAALCFERSGHGRGGAFMVYFSRYQAAKRRKSAASQEEPLSNEMKQIRSEVERHIFQARVEDPFMHYLYGLLTTKKTAMDALVKSVSGFPCHWEAWKELLKHVKNMKTMESLEKSLPNHWMASFFRIDVFIQLRQYQKALSLLKETQKIFPQSVFFYASMGKCMYHTGEYAHALTFFETVLGLDPHRTEDMEVYAALLYVMNKKVELAELAREFSKTKKFTPEACCIMGHHYSLRQNPKKAIEYFKRAVQLDDDCLNARMYMAQEYMEQRQHAEALEVLNEVVIRDRKNSQAWHLRGQAYELAGVLSLAEKAFTEACCLNPHEGAMWLSRGICNYRLEDLKLSETCLKRAEKEGCKDRAANIYLKKVQERLYPDRIEGEEAGVGEDEKEIERIF